MTLSRRRIANGLLALLALAIALPGVLYAIPSIAGADEAYVVRTGSMTPTLRVGDVIFVKAGPIGVGDIITYRVGDDLVTHRVVAARGDAYETKGDANEEADARVVPASDVVGKHAFTIPAWGLISIFARTTLGYVTLILLPGVALVAHQILRIRQARKEANA